MSGDDIQQLKSNNMVQNNQDIEYIKRLLNPFDEIVVERFEPPPSNRILIWIAVMLILFINFPAIKNKINLNEYITWIITSVILIGVIW